MSHDPFGWKGHTISGKYRVERVVGEGAFGVVYRAQHIDFNRPVAVKCLKLHELDKSQQDEFCQEFLEEGRLLHELSRQDAAIVQALDVGVTKSPSGIQTPYLVMEWLAGRTLHTWLEQCRELDQAPLPLDEAVALLEPVLRAVAVAHEQRIVHRDLKPSNIFMAQIGGRQTTKVLDFGIAKVKQKTMVGTSRYQPTMISRKNFSMHYGAPEQFDPSFRTTGPWTDVFALALIFVELFSGRRALEGENEIELGGCVTNPESRPTPRNRGAQLSDAAEAVFARALAIDPEDRYADAGAFCDALEGLSTTNQTAAPPAAPPQVAQRKRAPKALGVVLVLIALMSFTAVAVILWPAYFGAAESDAGLGGGSAEPSTAIVSAAEPEPAEPPQLEPTASNRPSGTGSTASVSSWPGGTRACNAAISAAIRRDCWWANRYLKRCDGSKRHVAKANVTKWCKVQ